MSCQQAPRSDIRRHGADSNTLCHQLLELEPGGAFLSIVVLQGCLVSQWFLSSARSWAALLVLDRAS